MTDTTTPARRTYGHWRKPASAGLGRLGTGPTIAFFGCAVVFVVLMIVSLWVALIGGAAMLLLLAPLAYRDGHGRTVAQNMAGRVNWLRAKRRRSNVYRSGPLARVAHGRHRLPGIAAPVEAVEAHDALGNRFALLHHTAKHHITVVLATSPNGATMMDREQSDELVAGWGVFLGQLGNLPGLVGAAVHIETAPDEGLRLRREVQTTLAPDGPALAKAVLGDIVDTYPAGAATLTSRITLTWRMQTPGGKRSSVDQMALEIGNRLPGLVANLASTGAGPARAVGVDELAATLRVAWDPAASAAVERAGPGKADVEWPDAGPVSYDEYWDWLRHDSGASISWVMTSAPRGLVFDSVLARLLGPHEAIDRKRVTIHYRPHDPGEAATVVERDRLDAISHASGGKRVSQARDVVSLNAANKTAAEEAAGAGLVRFAMTVTATLRDDSSESLDVAAAAMDNLAASARIRLRRAYGQQAVTFCAGLPLGLVLAEHSAVPAQLREAM